MHCIYLDWSYDCETDAADLGPCSPFPLGFSWPNAGGVAAVQRVQRGMRFGSGCSSSSGHAGGLMVAQHQQYEIFSCWWFQICFIFNLGNISNLTNIFQGGWNQHPVYDISAMSNLSTERFLWRYDAAEICPRAGRNLRCFWWWEFHHIYIHSYDDTVCKLNVYESMNNICYLFINISANTWIQMSLFVEKTLQVLMVSPAEGGCLASIGPLMAIMKQRISRNTSLKLNIAPWKVAFPIGRLVF